MAKSKFLQYISPELVLIYPHLTEADTKFDADGVFHTKGGLATDDAADMIEALEGVRDTFHEEWLAESKNAKEKKERSAWALADVAEVELDDEGDETGRSILRFKMKHNVTPKNSKPFAQEPKVFDSANTLLALDGLKLWGGSRVRIAFEVVPYAMASSKTVGVSLRLKAVQIIELSSAGGASPFDEYEGGETVDQAGNDEDDTPFDTDDGGDDAGGDY